MKNLTLENITKACKGVYHGDESKLGMEVEGVVIDSRKVQKGYLFVAIDGENVNAHQFIPDTIEKGALCVISHEDLGDTDFSYILVESTGQALLDIAKLYRDSFDIKVVGITGSVGKTSTKEMIASVVAQKYQVHKTIGNFNNEWGLPLTIFEMNEDHQVAILEMGVNHFGEMRRLSSVASPDICVITNIGLCHLENLITRDGILKAKTESFEHLAPDGIAVLNGDDDKLCDKKMVNGRPAVFYGIGQEAKTAETETGSKRLAEKEVYATDVEAIGLEGTKAVIHTPEQQFEVVIPIAGEHNVYNALAAVCVARRLGLDAEEMKLGIEHAHTIGGRSNLIRKNGITIIDDCYNANPVSMKAAIDVLNLGIGRRVAIVGNMGELGENAGNLHREVGAYLAQTGVDAVFAVGDLARSITDGFQELAPKRCARWFASNEELIPLLKDLIQDGDNILVKASNSMHFSEIVSALQNL